MMVPAVIGTGYAATVSASVRLFVRQPGNPAMLYTQALLTAFMILAKSN